MGDPAGGQGRRRGKKRKAALGAIVGWLVGYRWFTKLCPYHPKVIETYQGSNPWTSQVNNYLMLAFP